MGTNSKAVQKRADKKNPAGKCFAAILYFEDLLKLEYFTWESFAKYLDCKLWVSPCHDSDTWHSLDLVNDDGTLNSHFTYERFREYYAEDTEFYSLSEEDYKPSLWIGRLKKSHFHLVMQFTTTQRLKAVQSVFDYAFAAGRWKLPGSCPVQIQASLVKSVEYLIHFNHPEKFQYRREDVVLLNGANFNRCFITAREDESIDICDLIIKSGLDEYNEFYMFLRVNYPQYVKTFLSKEYSAQFIQMIKSNKFNPIGVVPGNLRLDENGDFDLPTNEPIVIVHPAEVKQFRLGSCDNLSYVKSYFHNRLQAPSYFEVAPTRKR